MTSLTVRRLIFTPRLADREADLAHLLSFRSQVDLMDVCSAKSRGVKIHRSLIFRRNFVHASGDGSNRLQRSEDMRAWTSSRRDECFCGLAPASTSPHLTATPLGRQSSTSLYSSQRHTSRHGHHGGSHFTARSSQRRQLATSSSLAAALPRAFARRVGRSTASCTISASSHTSAPFRFPFSLAYTFPPLCAAASSESRGGVARLGPISFYLEVLPSISNVGIRHRSAAGEIQVGS